MNSIEYCALCNVFNPINKDAKCKSCNKGICNECCLKLNETNIYINDRNEEINAYYQCPYCLYDENIIEFNKNNKEIFNEITKKTIKENQLLKIKLEYYKETIDKQNAYNKTNIENACILRELNRFVMKSQNKKTLKVDYIQNILYKQNMPVC